MRIFAIVLAGTALLAVSISSTTAAPRGHKGGVTGVPPHASTTGLSSRSDVASRHGANRRGFCPPGQAKKPGRGSAFNC